MDVKAGLRIAYCNKKTKKMFILELFLLQVHTFHVGSILVVREEVDVAVAPDVAQLVRLEKTLLGDGAYVERQFAVCQKLKKRMLNDNLQSVKR